MAGRLRGRIDPDDRRPGRQDRRRHQERHGHAAMRPADESARRAVASGRAVVGRSPTWPARAVGMAVALSVGASGVSASQPEWSPLSPVGQAAIPAMQRTVSVPVADDTTPCVLALSAWFGSVPSPDRPERRRNLCRREAEAGNLTARALYGQMVLHGYAGRPDRMHGLTILESAASDGSTLAKRTLGYLYYDGVALPRNYAVAHAWFASAARDGDTASMNQLGGMSADGAGQPIDDVAAYRYFVTAAEGGSAAGATNAGKFALAGRGVPRDPAVAVAWLARAAASGEPNAQFLLGLILVRGDGVPRDVGQGTAWLRAAADQQHTEARAVLGNLYLDGIGVPRDARRGFGLMSAAAQAGSSYAQRRLGDLYGSGTGVARDDAKARDWYRKAALAGDARARHALAKLYLSGRGGPVDKEAALGWMQGAAEAGLAAAQNDLGAMLRNGLGTRPDPAAAKPWFEKAAAQGDGAAATNLSRYAARGDGEPVDLHKALRLATRGAQRGDAAGALIAAGMTWRGEGTRVDRAQAMRWFRFAADRGDIDAARWVGYQLLTGADGMPRDEQAGLRYLSQAADAGDQAAGVLIGFHLGEHHQSFEGRTGLQWLSDLANRKVPAAYSALGSLYWREQPATAFDWFSRGARLGDVNSQAMLCTMHRDGSGTPRSPVEAARWCRAAAVGNHAGAMRVLASADNGLVAADERAYWRWKLADRGEPVYQSMLGDTYDLGDGVPVDFDAAMYWFRRAADRGDVSAQGSLAWHLSNGLGGRTDDYEAFAWALRAAPSSADAKRMVGVAYLHGRGVASDPKEAAVWLNRAASAGSPWAESELAVMYETGDGVPADEATALDLHRRASRQGSVLSEIALALRSVTPGTEAGLSAGERRWLVPADPATTLWSDPPVNALAAANRQWEGLSSLNEALRGDPFMQYAAGIRFLTGNGLPRDRALGAAWVERARASFDAMPGLGQYGVAATRVETRISRRLDDAEKRRAADIAGNLIATLP
ncbi:tetratricopeptide repeat protein [Burkholderia seminalis]|uniref:tetratricopeptide repeat protein n=1 Tax=Burkholderia seminalis TaxID=488731 RepID=UPI00264D9B84|nr:tetratricopeptide repeat protein [Burkholderia seminalis]MDN7592223.1 tetratricopeptide repeat protein [Burkholderia seminalis]